MGKREKKQKHQRNTNRGASYYLRDDGDGDEGYSSQQKPHDFEESDDENKEEEEEEEVEEEGDEVEEAEAENGADPSSNLPSKFHLYQQSVQSPKGDISYLQKFFLMYVGGRLPLHLQEDFCGTALLSTEWLRSDARRTAVGLDLDLEALEWCMENNINKVGADGYSRISLLHGNVLKPHNAKLVTYEPQELISDIQLNEQDENPETGIEETTLQQDAILPARDIICAFNYSCCCLHKRTELVQYFKHVLNALSKKGGIFVMDLYGGTSSEGKIRLQRRFPNFTYVWEQAEFDIIQRTTRISLHFHLKKQQKKLRHAFSYSWKLWSLPEIKDCLVEAGFKSVHFWIRNMPDAAEMRNTKGFGAQRDMKYEEVTNFQQQDAWNAYIVAVAK